MASREIIKLPGPILRSKAHKVKDLGKDFQTLVDDMIDTMRDEPGVGLAATQVKVPLRVIVIEYPEDDSIDEAKPKLYVVANPEILRVSEEKVKGLEGCLSVPNIVGDVVRSEEIQVEGLNREGKKITIRAKGWLARIFQHEIDHLNGILFVDRAVALYEPGEIQTDTPNV